MFGCAALPRQGKGIEAGVTDISDTSPGKLREHCPMDIAGCSPGVILGSISGWGSTTQAVLPPRALTTLLCGHVH